MNVLVPNVTWVRGYFRPERVHMMETCDGKPRTADFGDRYGMLVVAVCGNPLGSTAVDSPNVALDELCSACRDIADQLGGLA